MTRKNITGIILAGGKASRLGGIDKGLVEVNGQPCIERIMRAMAPVVNGIIIIANNDAYKPFSRPVYRDIFKGKGPIGGIHAGLSFTKTAGNLVVSCDMPNVSTGLFEHILALRYHVLVPSFRGELQPLCAYYSSGCRDILERLIRLDILTMKEAIYHLGFREVPITSRLGFFRRDIFSNLNTPADIDLVNTPAAYES